jgi:hypothetical protein
MRGVPKVTEKFEMGGRNEIEPRRSHVRPAASVSAWLLSSLRQEPNLDAKGEQLLLSRLSG